MCNDACGSNDLDMGVISRGPDPIEYISIAQDRFGGFFEPVEVQVWGDQIAACTGVQGLTVYRAADACCMSLAQSIQFEAGSARFPRCQHFARTEDRVVITHRGDEIQPEPFLTVVDISDLDNPQTLSTFMDGATSFEGVAVVGDRVYSALHESGLAVFRIEGDGELTEITRITDGVTNAWKPLVDPGGGFLYLADAGGGLKTYSLADPDRPALVGQLSTLGTLKDLVQLGDILYGAAGSIGVEVIDVSDPAQPSLLTTLNTTGSALGVDANDQFLIVADWNATQVYETNDPRSPRYIGHQKGYKGEEPSDTGRILDVALRGNEIFMAEWTKLQAHRINPGVEAPDLWTSAFVEIPRTAIGESTSFAVAVENLGTQPLQISSVNIAAPFSVSPSSLSIEPGRRDLITITFTPDSEGRAQGDLTIISNDPDEGAYQIYVQANLPGLSIGDAVPNLVFDTLDGMPIDLESQRGGPVLLAYFATF